VVPSHFFLSFLPHALAPVFQLEGAFSRDVSGPFSSSYPSRDSNCTKRTSPARSLTTSGSFTEVLLFPGPTLLSLSFSGFFSEEDEVIAPLRKSIDGRSPPPLQMGDLVVFENLSFRFFGPLFSCAYRQAFSPPSPTEFFTRPVLFFFSSGDRSKVFRCLFPLFFPAPWKFFFLVRLPNQIEFGCCEP